MKTDLWSVVLAGGEGERTRPFIERWLGYHKPKQYCTFSGDRSLFQQTVDRADRLAGGARRVTVVASDRVDEARSQLRGRAEGVLLSQPANRGTAPGLLYALARIQAEDPDAVVVTYPSDHFVYLEEAFLSTISRAAAAAAHDQAERLVLVGVEPEGPESDYGWIQPGATVGGLRRVASFAEKPPPERSRALMAAGALWNSMILAGRVATFWTLMERTIPETTLLFGLYRDLVGTSQEKELLASLYDFMPVNDFSRDVLEPARDALAVLPLEGAVWSDWGRPKRIVQTLSSIGAEPAFSKEHVESSGSVLSARAG